MNLRNLGIGCLGFLLFAVLVSAANTISNSDELWPDGVIPYIIDPALSHPDVLDVIQHWNENTVIRLVERTDQSNWVRFVPGRGCRAGWWTSSNTSGRQGEGITDRNQLAALTLHALFSHVPQTRQGHQIHQWIREAGRGDAVFRKHVK